jgi:hypothetical protein
MLILFILYRNKSNENGKEILKQHNSGRKDGDCEITKPQTVS